jgi:hypothetical protein
MNCNQCDVCGQFIAYKEFAYMGHGGKAIRRLVTPDSEFTGEEWETLCPIHAEVSNNGQAKD